MLPEELLWVVAFNDIPTYRAMVTAIPVLARKITLGTQCDHKIHFGYDVRVEKDRYGYYIAWRLKDYLHRIDNPATEYADGRKEYYLNDNLHRIDGPAIERVNGGKDYYLNGKLHRTDGPARKTMGDIFYYLDGKLHRTDGPAVEFTNGYKAYYLNDKRHRIDGPAVECASGDKEYFQDGKRHRTDGPAIDFTTGRKAYYINDVGYTPRDYHLMVFQL